MLKHGGKNFATMTPSCVCPLIDHRREPIKSEINFAGFDQSERMQDLIYTNKALDRVRLAQRKWQIVP